MKNTITITLFVAAAVSAAVFQFARTTSAEEQGHHSPESPVELQEDLSIPLREDFIEIAGLGSQSWGEHVLFNSDGFDRYVRFDRKPYRVILESASVNPVDGGTERYSREYSLAMTPVAARGVTADDFFVIGYGRFNQTVIERWQLKPDLGVYHSVRQLPGTIVGVPVSMGTTSTRVNGDYTSPSRMDRKELLPTRVEVYRDDAIGAVLCFNVDREGRYLLVVSTDGDGISRLRQVHLNESRQPDILYDESILPSLVDATHIRSMIHDTNGFCWKVEGGDVESFLWDADYDGVINSVENHNFAVSNTLYPVSDFALEIE